MSDTISLRLPSELSARLSRLAESTRRPKSFYVRAALEEHLNDIEWAYDLAAPAEGARTGATQTRQIDALTDELGFNPEELRAETRESSVE